MVHITKMFPLEFHIAFAGSRTALSDLLASQTGNLGGIYGARVDGTYAGFLIAADDVEHIRITYAFTVPEFRRQGVFTSLMQHVKDLYQQGIRMTIPSTHECYEILKHTCEILGFTAQERVHVFSCSRKDEDRWRLFMEKKGKRLCDMLRMHGYNPVCFRTMGESLTSQLRDSDHSAYGNMFHPALFLDDPAKKLSLDLSFAAEKNGRLASYCLVIMVNDTSAVFEQISVSSEEMGQGVILLPYVYSMERFFEMDLQSAYYAMYESNKHANAFRKKVLKIFPSNETVQENYYYQHR